MHKSCLAFLCSERFNSFYNGFFFYFFKAFVVSLSVTGQN